MKLPKQYRLGPVKWRDDGAFAVLGRVPNAGNGTKLILLVYDNRIAVIVSADTSMSIFGSTQHEFFAVRLSDDVNYLFTGNHGSVIDAIDRNLALSQAALAAIDAVQIPAGNTALANDKTHALFIAGFGTASPPMAAAAMLLLYQFTLALFIGLSPLFILCLIFDQSKDLFRRWLLYGIGTIFSIAMLSFVASLVLTLTENVAIALWGATAIAKITDTNAEGFSAMALQQGGLGLLMTVLIVSVPPLAAGFFQGTVGNFLTYSAFGMGGAGGLGPQGQPPGSYGYREAYGGAAPSSNTLQTGSDQTATNANNSSNLGRMTGKANVPQPDLPKSGGRPSQGGWV